MDKLYTYGFILILVLLGAWKYTSMAEEIGQKDQQIADVKKANKTLKENYDKAKKVGEAGAVAIEEASKKKRVLNTYALKLAHELEILKYENSEIKKWSITVMPRILTYRLLDKTSSEPGDGLPSSAESIIKANAGTYFEARNENLYNYANDLKAAIRSCNTDKVGINTWVEAAAKILEAQVPAD